MLLNLVGYVCIRKNYRAGWPIIWIVFNLCLLCNSFLQFLCLICFLFSLCCVVVFTATTTATAKCCSPRFSCKAVVSASYVRNGISSRREYLHHFRHRTKHRSRHFNHANYTNPFPVYFHFRFLQTNANIQAHISYCCITLLSIDIGQHMSKFLLFEA